MTAADTVPYVSLCKLETHQLLMFKSPLEMVPEQSYKKLEKDLKADVMRTLQCEKECVFDFFSGWGFGKIGVCVYVSC